MQIILPKLKAEAYHVAIEQVHAHIEDETFNLLWSEGQKMTLDDGIAYALGST